MADKFNPYILRPERGDKPDSWAYPTRGGGSVAIVIRHKETGRTVSCDISRERIAALAEEMNRRIAKDRKRRK